MDAYMPKYIFIQYERLFCILWSFNKQLEMNFFPRCLEQMTQIEFDCTVSHVRRIVDIDFDKRVRLGSLYGCTVCVDYRGKHNVSSDFYLHAG